MAIKYRHDFILVCIKTKSSLSLDDNYYEVLASGESE
jgi:hypothetical protein